MSIAACLSTGKDDWETPDALFKALDAEFGFVIDVAANADNAKCEAWYGPGSPLDEEDALTTSWGSYTCWCNPPYSRGLQAKFIEKAYIETKLGATVVMLLPARTDTRAFHQFIWDREFHRPLPWVREVRFLRGRLRFVGAPASAPFPSMIVVFGE